MLQMEKIRRLEQGVKLRVSVPSHPALPAERAYHVPMPFPPKVREEALVRSRRCCCVCHEFHGRNLQVHHVMPEADGGANTIYNATALCLRCHAEAGHYNS